MMVKLRATWNIPGDGDVHAADRAFFDEHVAAIRSLPGVVRHATLQAMPNARGGHPAWWRGEDVVFADRAALEQAASSKGWGACWNARFGGLVAGPRIDVFEILEEFEPPDAPPAQGAQITALSGIWQVPAHLTPEQVDPVYFDVHVPGVRRLPRLMRHTVMRAVDWPEGQYARAHRSAEVRFASPEEFYEVFASPAYDAIRNDGFNASVVGPDVDIYRVEEWHAD